MSGFRSLGDILQESATISFDTSTGLFFNPVTGTSYGSNPPPGGWPISWYKDSSGQVQVPTGPGAVAQTPAQAAALAQTVVQQLAAQQAPPATGPVPAPAPAPTVAAAPAPVPVSTGGTDLTLNVPYTNATVDLAQLWSNYWWAILAAGGALFLFSRRG